MEAGREVLASGGEALDAVIASVRSMEQSPWFNAGRGAVLTSEGTVEFDASLMCGRTRRAGAIACARTPRYPIEAARTVMETDRHVLLVGEGADSFIQSTGLETASLDYFLTDERRAQLERMVARERYALDHDPTETDTYGTVGAVALDTHGDLAAATSTGGMVNQWVGRVGDSAIIGAGTWADERCAISATGHGEAFIRGRCAGRVADLIELSGMSLEAASKQVIDRELTALGGRGGLIGVDRNGAMVMPFCTGGMFRAWTRPGEEIGTGIW
jgi:isoaspartyl peptidase/L-asparaginase-like protein (Ntn-hydrolase superfamily)